MAQYGKNYYGASYYGISGVFAGQFLSDPTRLVTPISDVSPSDGKLYFDLICSHPKVSYGYASDIFILGGSWSGNTTQDSSFNIQCNVVGSDFLFRYNQRIDGAVVGLVVETYENGVLKDTDTHVIDTKDPGPYEVTPSSFGEQIITVVRDLSSGDQSVLEFEGIDIVTTDVRLEYKSKQDLWSEWLPADISVLESNVSYNGFGNVYKYLATTENIAGATEYQFKLMLASSDNTNSPEVIELDVHTASTEDYAPDGYWKITADLTEDIGSIDSIVFNVDQSEDTKVEVRSRSSDIDGNWSPWSLPYTSSPYRVVANYKAVPVAGTKQSPAYIITPVINPDNLTEWKDFLFNGFVNTKDTLSGSETPGAYIEIQVVNEDYNANPQTTEESNANRVYYTFSFNGSSDDRHNLQNLPKGTPVRFKITLVRTLGTASPAIESLYSYSSAYYNEYREFGTEEGQIRAYGSAVYGNNTGIDKVYTDGTVRNTEAKISSFDFTIPADITDPEYIIEPDTDFSGEYTSDEVDIYWASNGGKRLRLDDILADDVLMVRVKESRVGNKVKRHYRYGSGVVLSLDPEFISAGMTNTFNPSLESKEYAFLLRNGFGEDDHNEKLSIRWQSENTLLPSGRKNIAYSMNDRILVGIISGETLGAALWVSEQKKFEGTVNPNGTESEYSAIITDLPSLEWFNADKGVTESVIIDPDPTTIPYRVEVIEGSVTSNGSLKPEERITGTVRYLYGGTAPSLVESVEMKAEVVRGRIGSKDRLPKAMVKGITGVYSLANATSSSYAKGIHYDYNIDSGSIYSNEIDWAKGIALGMCPEAGSIYYVTYRYDKVVSLKVKFECDYAEYESSPQIYRSPVISLSGECSAAGDYVSSELSTDMFSVDPDVDPSTLRYRVYDDSPRVRTYIDGNKVIGTLDGADPRESWQPTFSGGYYYAGRERFYMFSNPVGYKLGGSLIPIARNISYAPGKNGTGVRIEEETQNLLLNNRLNISEETAEIFSDSFLRT